MPGLPSSLFMHELARRWSQVQAEQQSYERAAQTVGALGEQQYGEQAKQAGAMGAMLQGSGRPLSEVAHLPDRLRERAELSYAQEGVDTARAAAAAESAAKLKLLLRSMQEEGATDRTLATQLGLDRRTEQSQQAALDRVLRQQAGANYRTNKQTEGLAALRSRLPSSGSSEMTPKDVLKFTGSELGKRLQSSMRDLQAAEKNAKNYYTGKVMMTPELQRKRDEVIANNAAYLEFMHQLVKDQPDVAARYADTIQGLLDLHDTMTSGGSIDGEGEEDPEVSEEDKVLEGF